MKLVQLLSGAAAVALISGVASAQTVTVDAGSGVAAAGETLAAEIDLSTAGQTADLVINLDFSGPVYSTLGGGDNIDFTVNLTGFEFTRVITSGDIVDGTADANCAFAIEAGGGDTGTSVTFRSTGSINACASANVDITLPIEVTAADANFAWEANLVGPDTLLDSDTYDADGGTAGDQPLVPTANEFTVAITDGAAPTDLASPDYVLFGVSDEDEFGAVAVLQNGVAFADLAGGALAFDTVATDSNTLTITLADATGIDYIEVDVSSDGADAGTDPQCVPSGTTCAVTLTGAQMQGSIGAAHPIVVVSENNVASPIAAQALSGTVALAAETGFDVSGIGGLTGDLDPIDRDDGVTETAAFGDFPWTSLRATGGTTSRFRITGLDTDLTNDSDECILVAINDTTAALAGYTVPVCIPNVVIGASEGTDDGTAGEWTATFSSTDIAEALGITTEAVNGNVEFQIRYEDSLTQAGQSALRLLTRNGIVSGTGFDN